MPLKASCPSCPSCLYNKILEGQLKSLVISGCLLIVYIIALNEATTRQLWGSCGAATETIDNKQLTNKQFAATNPVAVKNRCRGQAQPRHPSLSFLSFFFSVFYSPWLLWAWPGLSPFLAGPGVFLTMGKEKAKNCSKIYYQFSGFGPLAVGDVMDIQTNHYYPQVIENKTLTSRGKKQ